MAQSPNLAALLGGVQPQIQQHQVLTSEQKAEILKVQGMQVRTQAAGIASNVMEGTACSPQDFVALAKVVELYITGVAGT